MKATGLWVIDVQEKLFPHIDHGNAVAQNICFAIECAKILEMPIFVTEQMPEKLGQTLPLIKEKLPEGQAVFAKSTFSGWRDAKVRSALEKTGIKTWILIGIEAHICVLQAAKDLLQAGFEVIVLNDAISSRNLFDFSTAIAEMRDAGARISSAETLAYEMVEDAACSKFKNLLPLIKERA